MMPFALEFIVLAPLVLAGGRSNAVGAVVFLLPWILALFTVINLPLLAAAVRAFQLDNARHRLS
jgi:hypothetical protein